MNALGSREFEARGFASTPRIRDLTTEELDEVAGGIVPVAIVVAVAVAVALEEFGDDSSSDSEEGGGDAGDAGGDD